MGQDDGGSCAWQRLALPSSIVDRQCLGGPPSAPLQGAPSGPGSTHGSRCSGILERTTAVHGMTGAEVERCSDAIHFMSLHCQRRRSSLWWLTTDKGTSRDKISAIGKRITKLQRRFFLPAYSLTVLETRSALHAHIVFVGNRKIADRLSQSKVFGCEIAVAPVPKPDRLARTYLVKERTPQAGYRRQHLLGGRIPGSHRLDGGGDRVRLSRDLEAESIAGGFLKPWRHSNARRNHQRKPYQRRDKRSSAGPLQPIAPTSAANEATLASLESTEGNIWADLLHAFA